MKLAAARLFVRDLQEARVFYEQKLGLRVGTASPEAGFVVFEAQSCDLVVERESPEALRNGQALVGRFTVLAKLRDPEGNELLLVQYPSAA